MNITNNRSLSCLSFIYIRCDRPVSTCFIFRYINKPFSCSSLSYFKTIFGDYSNLRITSFFSCCFSICQSITKIDSLYLISPSTDINTLVWVSLPIYVTMSWDCNIPSCIWSFCSFSFFWLYFHITKNLRHKELHKNTKGSNSYYVWIIT